MSGIRCQASGVSAVFVPNISYICNLVNTNIFFLKFFEKKWNIGTNDYYCCISMFLDDFRSGTWWYKVVQNIHSIFATRARKMYKNVLLSFSKNAI